MPTWIRTKFLFCVVRSQREEDRCKLKYDRFDHWEIETTFRVREVASLLRQADQLNSPN